MARLCPDTKRNKKPFEISYNCATDTSGETPKTISEWGLRTTRQAFVAD